MNGQLYCTQTGRKPKRTFLSWGREGASKPICCEGTGSVNKLQSMMLTTWRMLQTGYCFGFKIKCPHSLLQGRIYTCYNGWSAGEPLCMYCQNISVGREHPWHSSQSSQGSPQASLHAVFTWHHVCTFFLVVFRTWKTTRTSQNLKATTWRSNGSIASYISTVQWLQRHTKPNHLKLHATGSQSPSCNAAKWLLSQITAQLLSTLSFEQVENARSDPSAHECCLQSKCSGPGRHWNSVPDPVGSWCWHDACWCCRVSGQSYSPAEVSSLHSLAINAIVPIDTSASGKAKGALLVFCIMWLLALLTDQ